MNATNRFDPPAQAPPGVALVNVEGRVLAWNAAAEHLTGWTAAQMHDRPFAAGCDELLAAAPAGFALALRDPDGADLRLHAWSSPLVGTDQYTVTFVGSDPPGASASAHSCAASRLGQFQEVAELLGSADSVEQVAAVTLERGFSFVGADAGSVALLDETGTQVCIARVRGYPEDVQQAWARFPLAAGVPICDAMLTGEPVWLNSRAQWAELYPDLAARYHDTNYTTAAAIPLKVSNRIVGCLGLSYSTDRSFSDEEKAFVTTLACQCALAIDRTQTREAEQRAHHKLQSVLDSMTEGLVVLDRDWRYVYVSETAASMLGARREDFIGESIWDMFPRPDTSDCYQHYHRAMQTGQPVHFEEFYPEPLNRWLECHCYPSEEGLAIYFHDVTRLRRSDEALRESTALLRAISDHTDDVIFAKDRDGRFTFANPATLRTLDRSAEQVLGKTDADFYASDIADAVVVNDRRIMDSGVGEDCEETVPIADGTQRVWTSRKMPYRDANGQVIGLLGISRDITERLKMEGELRRRAQELLASDRTKDEFLAMLAHELRNPLGAIGNAAALIEMQVDSQPLLRRPVEILNRQVEHTARLVDDLLDVSRITRGKLELRSERLDLCEVARRTAELARPGIAVKRHTFVVTLPSTPVWVLGDAVRLEQAIGNLLGNAIKYTNSGGHVTLSLAQDDGDARIEITDNGQGIAADMLPRVFDLFTQEDRSLARSKGGLGIGLTLVKRLVELHGGHVVARSEGPGRGSEVVVQLPMLP